MKCKRKFETDFNKSNLLLKDINFTQAVRGSGEVRVSILNSNKRR